MIHRLLLMAGFAALCATTLPSLSGRFLESPEAGDAARTAKGAPVALRPAAGAREVVLSAGRGGHFEASFEMNGRPVRGLVDTGATSVAINESTARRIGVSLSALGFSVPVSTANGVVKAAPVTVKRITVGGIAIGEVEALVLPDKALSGTLVGMSFLKRLSSFRVENGTLILRR
jgi:aspartyl protease family protein